jgi:hypothetical protein
MEKQSKTTAATNSIVTQGNYLMFNAKTEAAKLKADKITFEQVGNELDYRKNAGISSPEPGKICCGWDDDLCEYTTAELEATESAWDNA